MLLTRTRAQHVVPSVFDFGVGRSGRGYESPTVNDSSGIAGLVHYPEVVITENRRLSLISIVGDRVQYRSMVELGEPHSQTNKGFQSIEGLMHVGTGYVRPTVCAMTDDR